MSESGEGLGNAVFAGQSWGIYLLTALLAH